MALRAALLAAAVAAAQQQQQPTGRLIRRIFRERL